MQKGKINTEKGRYFAMERERERGGGGNGQKPAESSSEWACEVIDESLVDPTDSGNSS